MAQLIEALRSTAAKWRAGNQEHREGVVLVWDGEVYGWKDELRDPASERPGAYAVDKGRGGLQVRGRRRLQRCKSVGRG
ncbi:hypothetical protein PCPL58_4321 [Pseudomonas cerasi]|uniref:Antirestriction protein ArdR n=1 Tax=Pseudomonas cerasi TaxID=1583341 RepID=A0A193SX31_9PSED|nr:hypothetical protein PCPL58_4321 [Pseudomonas cerasi]SOS22880.1 hypothetical protein PL963_04414 [Pseudomonas cerasi]